MEAVFDMPRSDPSALRRVVGPELEPGSKETAVRPFHLPATRLLHRPPVRIEVRRRDAVEACEELRGDVGHGLRQVDVLGWVGPSADLFWATFRGMPTASAEGPDRVGG